MDAKIDSHQVESIGAVAGQVWQYLDAHGSVTPLTTKLPATSTPAEFPDR